MKLKLPFKKGENAILKFDLHSLICKSSRAGIEDSRKHKNGKKKSYLG